MTKKGVDTVAKDPAWLNMPIWLKALIDPEILENQRRLQLKQHALGQERLLAMKQLAIQQGTQKNQSHEMFELKQRNGREHYQCDITPDHFLKGSELEWIRMMLSLDHEDRDPDHVNKEHIRRIIQEAPTDQAKEVIDKLSIEDTKDQKANPLREINQIFPDYLLSTLEKSPSKALIIQLVNSDNKTEPLALVLLKGQNGLWLHDPKLGCTVDFDHTNITGFRQFLMDLIKVNHPGCHKASLIQLGNKDKLKTQKEPEKRFKDTAKVMQKAKLEQTPQVQPTIEETKKSKEVEKEKTKPKP